MNVTIETMVQTLALLDFNNSEKIVLLFLNLKSDENGMVKISNRSLAESTGLAEITISKALENLEILGMITRGFELNRNVPGGIERTIEIIK